jgi:hypothetical protein
VWAEWRSLLYPFSFQPRDSFNWLEQAVFALDRWLRQRQGVYEYTNHPSCLFRVQRAQAEFARTLSDGTNIAAGDNILKLHLWNEHMASIGENGVSVAWAQQINRAVQISLTELARHVVENDLDSVVAVRADIRLGTAEQSAQLIRIASRYGFEAASPDTIQDGTLHRFGENIYLFLLVLATNPITVGAPVLRRDHTLVYLSRRTLEQYYRGTAKHAENKEHWLC